MIFASSTSKTFNEETPAIANQTVSAATTAQVVGSKVTIPSTRLKVGTILRWRLTVSKTAAGTAAVVINVKLGINGTVADANVLTFTFPVGTAVVDSGVIEIECSVRSIGAAGVIQGVLWMGHNLTSTGLANVPNVVKTATSGALNMTTANLKTSLAITTPASTVWTVHQASVEAVNL